MLRSRSPADCEWKARVVLVQAFLMLTVGYDLAQGEYQSATIGFFSALYIEKIFAWILKEMTANGARTAQYISNNYSSITRLGEVMSRLPRQSVEEVKQAIITLTSTRP